MRQQELGERERVLALERLTGPDPGAGHGRGGHRTTSGWRTLVGVRAPNGASEAAMGVNQWPASQAVLTCPTGPLVDGQVQRSDTQAGAWQVGSGQATMSTDGSFQEAVTCRQARRAAFPDRLPVVFASLFR
jgi:hypothetical protein